MKQLFYLLKVFLFFIAFFALGKVFFYVYNQSECPFSLNDFGQVWMHGLSMDASTTGYLIVFPWLCCIISLWWKRFHFRRTLTPYYFFVAIVLSSILLGDTLLYEFWKFKIDSSVFAYLQNPEGVVASVSTPYLIGGTIALLVLCSLMLFLLHRITPKSFPVSSKPSISTFAFFIIGGLLFLIIRGGVQASTMNVGKAYFSEKLFLNHAAVNPVFSIFSSLSKNKQFSQQFRFFEQAECDKLFTGLYPTDTEDITDTLLTTNRPKVLVLLLEGFGATYIEELGGMPNVSPCISKLITEGILFDRVYANSFRTDRGLASALSGQVSYPTASLMRLPAKFVDLPSLARSLKSIGYDSDFTYGGDITYVGMQSYLISTGYNKLVSNKDFSFAQAFESKWGVHDGHVLDNVYQQIKDRPTDCKWLSGVLTLSSHEPFEVPYQQWEDPIQNAFAYTDYCVGDFIEKLRGLPIWKDLLVVIMPDHSVIQRTTFENPEFFHIPVLWVGGAVREPRRIHTLMNQSDVAATLLSQMNVPHRDYPWSRNVLSKNYTYPFAYSTFSSGILFTDSTGVSIYDINSNQEIVSRPLPSLERTQKAKAILQASYDDLDGLGSPH